MLLNSIIKYYLCNTVNKHTYQDTDNDPKVLDIYLDILINYQI